MIKSCSLFDVVLLALIHISIAHTTAPVLANATTPAFLSDFNLTTVCEAAITRSKNITYHPKNFLGVHCYRLQPATVTQEACQNLFAKLFEKGDAYEEIEVYNGWRAQYNNEPCIIMVASPSRRDGRVKVSMAGLITQAIEVLRTCTETSTGGAYTFDGNWQMVVTKEPVKITLRHNCLVGERALRGYTCPVETT